MNLRIGLGEDRHRLGEKPSGPLRLGGVDVPHERGLVGHSDADVLLHAVTDALLGAIAAPDIGELFPNTAAENRRRDSADFLREAIRRVSEKGYEVANLDCVVHAQQPKLAPYKDAIRHSLAGLLGIAVGQVNVKAKTGESVGPVGREEAIDARCVALLVSRQPAAGSRQ